MDDEELKALAEEAANFINQELHQRVLTSCEEAINWCLQFPDVPAAGHLEELLVIKDKFQERINSHEQRN